MTNLEDIADITDTWAGPATVWAWSALQFMFHDSSPIDVVVTCGALIWTILKACNELTRRRILARTEREQRDSPETYGGPYRRRSDPVHVIKTTPGDL